MSLFEHLLPRHMMIIYEINQRFLEEMQAQYPGDGELLHRMSIIEEGAGKEVRMANLAIVGSHSVNGVAALHSESSRTTSSATSSSTGRASSTTRPTASPSAAGCLQANPGSRLAHHLQDRRRLGEGPLRAEKAHSPGRRPGFPDRMDAVKRANKERLAEYIWRKNAVGSIVLDIRCQIKRLHEYKRQFLNVLHVITCTTGSRTIPAGASCRAR